MNAETVEQVVAGLMAEIVERARYEIGLHGNCYLDVERQPDGVIRGISFRFAKPLGPARETVLLSETDDKGLART